MRILRVITEGPEHVVDSLESFILDKVLRPHLGAALRVHSAGRAAGPASSARSRLIEGRRVVLVLNTGTLSFKKIRRQMAILEDLLGMAAYRDRWRIVLMRPHVTILFFHDLEILRQLTGRAPTDEELTRAQAQPQEVLAEMLGVPPEDLFAELRRRLDSVDLRSLAAQPQVRAILDFQAPPRPESYLVSP